MSSALQTQQRAEERRAPELADREVDTLAGEVVSLIERNGDRQQLVLETAHERIALTVYGEGGTLWPGQHLRVRGRLRAPVGLRGIGTRSERLQRMAEGTQLAASAKYQDVEVLSQGLSLWRVPMALRSWAQRQIPEEPRDGAAILMALTTGDRSRMGEPLTSAVRAAGLAHLLAVSGMHMAAVVGAVFLLALLLWSALPWRQHIEPKTVAAVAGLGVALLFAAVTGARPSTCRALLVVSMVLVGVALDRRISLMSALSWAALVLLLWRPALLWDIGFEMSFAASFALAIAFTPGAGPLRFEPRGLRARFLHALWSVAKASFWASFATLPIALYHFGEVSPWALVANVAAVPLVTVVLLPASLVGLLVTAIAPGIGGALLGACATLAEAIAWCCFQLAELLPGRPQAPLSTWEFFLWFALALVLLLGPQLRRRWRACGLAVLVAALAFLRLADREADSTVRITFVDIGQGDAAVVELPDGEVWLVDGGGLPFVAEGSAAERQHLAETPARRALLPYLRHRRIRAIDVAILSHPHPDHFVGLQAVARTMPIREVWSAHARTGGAFEAWLDELRKAGTEVRAPMLGTARRTKTAALEVLWPRYTEDARSTVARPDPILSVNDNSLVVRLVAHGRTVLFSGDIESEAEELLVAEFGAELQADLVKVPHHGSRTSSTPAFVEATYPQVAVISCGRANRFGFPASEVLARWQRVAKVLRTDLVGSITVHIARDGAMWLDTYDPF